MKKRVGWLVGLVVVLFMVLLIACIAVSIAVVQSKPLVTANAPVQLDGADSVNELLAQLKTALSKRKDNHVITLTEIQIESLVGVLQRSVPNFKGMVNVSDLGGTIAFTFSPSDFDIYFNVTGLILPGNTLQIDHVSVGDLSLPGNLVLSALEKGVNYWTESEIATLALTRIDKVAMREGEVSLHLAPLDAFLSELNAVSANLSMDDGNDELETLTAYYLRYIAGRDLTLSARSMPIIEYLREGMARAREQSTTPEEAVFHNKAVILALATLVGHHRVGNLVGDIQPRANKALKPRAPAILKQRNDLARHFIISAALQLLSEEGMSLAIGEFKELMDRGEGGTGYSFVDLAADMAGAEFAKTATHPQYASKVQNDIARIQSDSDIMPDITGLPEGLTKQVFTERYGQVDSEAYISEVREIQRRITSIPLYSLTNL